MISLNVLKHTLIFRLKRGLMKSLNKTRLPCCSLPVKKGLQCQENSASAFVALFGEDAQLPPANDIGKKRFVIRTSVIWGYPERSAPIGMRVIDGSRYILIPAVYCKIKTILY